MNAPKRYTLRLQRRLQVNSALAVPAGQLVLASATLAAQLLIEDAGRLEDPALLPELLAEVDEWDRAAA